MQQALARDAEAKKAADAQAEASRRQAAQDAERSAYLRRRAAAYGAGSVRSVDSERSYESDADSDVGAGPVHRYALSMVDQLISQEGARLAAQLTDVSHVRGASASTFVSSGRRGAVLCASDRTAATTAQAARSISCLGAVLRSSILN